MRQIVGHVYSNFNIESAFGDASNRDDKVLKHTSATEGDEYYPDAQVWVVKNEEKNKHRTKLNFHPRVYGARNGVNRALVENWMVNLEEGPETCLGEH